MELSPKTFRFFVPGMEKQKIALDKTRIRERRAALELLRVRLKEDFVGIDEIVDSLPKQIWITFDIDGLDPKLCPNTGTPVPGGLELAQAVHLISLVARSGRTIIGFDLNEVGPTEFDGNVGARLLYKLCGHAVRSHREK